MTTSTSIWATAARQKLNDNDDEPLYCCKKGDFNFAIKLIGDTLWVITDVGKDGAIGFRTAYSPDGFTNVNINIEHAGSVVIDLEAAIGKYRVNINWPLKNQPALRYSVSLTPLANLDVPFWPRDIVIHGRQVPDGDTPVKQTGARSGLLYGIFKQPAEGAFLYLQNLTALADYNIDTETSAGGIVGGQWPELGLSLPPIKGKPMQKGKTYIISDALIALSSQSPRDQFEIARGFLTALSDLYLLLPRPETQYQNYLDTLQKTLHDLQTNKGCWSHRSGHPYLNAYLCDYNTPPEIMVQLAVLLPVREYMSWSGEDCSMAQEIVDGLSAFYNEQLGTVMRWLPAEEERLDKSEEQKTPMVMDSWYLHHPLLNLARMATAGDGLAKDLLMKSVDYAIKVAQHFNYCWPVFYKMDTLEVIKAETKPGNGGEKDVAGLYAHVMLQVWELTKDSRFFEEAEKAAQSMLQHGFDVLYQANNTMFSAKAMVVLYRETKKELYRNLAYLFLANIFKNVALWQCRYGFGPNFPTFFQLYPLDDAPYTAVYEEQEAYAGAQELLNYANGIELLPAVRLLLAEYIRYAIHRMIFYYPPMLPQEMLAKQTKTGELDPKLWIALEDLHDGWEPSGTVGQEVYGAGLAFGIVPRQYIRIPGQHFIVFTDYPVLNQTFEGNTLSFDVLGDSRLTCSLRIVCQAGTQLPAINIKTTHKDDQQQSGILRWQDNSLEKIIHGDQKITIEWE